MEVGVVASLEAVPGPEGDGRLQVFEGNLRVPLERVSRSQRVADVVTVGLEPVGSLQILDSRLQRAGVEFSHS